MKFTSNLIMPLPIVAVFLMLSLQGKDMQFFIQNVKNEISNILKMFEYNIKLTRAACWITSFARKKKTGASSPLVFFYPMRMVNYRWSKYNLLASLCLANYLAVNWLQKLETKHRVYYAEVIPVFICVCVCVCGISVWFIYNKKNCLFVRCQSLSHIPNTSLRCSNQPLWRLNLMMGVKTTK